MNYPNSRHLMDHFNKLAKAALAAEDYFTAQAFTTAEDLTDGLLKGYPADGPNRLEVAFQHNADRATGAEREAWLKALTILGNVA